MPIPRPNANETRNAFVSRCTGTLVSNEGMDSSQAAAICHSKWEDVKGLSMEYSQIAGVEIFRVGTHNGDTYTSQDIDDIISAFDELDYQPALKLGHDSSPGAPAVGYVTKLWREGNTLMANFSDIPEKVFEAIKQKMFNRVSAEIWFNLDRAGKTYRRALKALALLGAQVPAVAGLRPLEEMFSDFRGDIHLAEVTFSQTSDDAAASAAKGGVAQHSHGDIMSDEQKITVDDLAAKVEKLTEALGVKDKQIADLTAERDAIKETQNSESDEAIAKSISNLTRDQKAKQIVELNAKVDTLIKQLDATTESEKLAAKKLAEKEEQIRKLSEAGRRDRIDKLAEQCSIPAMRPFVRVFSDLATREEEVRVYNEETERQEDALVVVERLISFCNNGSERLFTTYSREGSTQRGEGGYDASDELDRRIRKHQQQHPDVDYVAARDYVLDNDPQLKAEYAAALQ